LTLQGIAGYKLILKVLVAALERYDIFLNFGHEFGKTQEIILNNTVYLSYL